MADLFLGGKVACPYEDACPHLNLEPAARVLAQRDYLSQRVDEMERITDLAREKIEKLEAENKALKEEKESLKQGLRESNLRVFKPNLKKEENKKREALPLVIEVAPGEYQEELISISIFTLLDATIVEEKRSPFIRSPLRSMWWRISR